MSEASHDGSMEALEAELATLTAEEIRQRTMLLENDVRVMTSTMNTLRHQMRSHEAQIKDNKEKVKLNCSLPYLVSTVAEVSGVGREGATWGPSPAPPHAAERAIWLTRGREFAAAGSGVRGGSGWGGTGCGYAAQGQERGGEDDDAAGEDGRGAGGGGRGG